MLQRVWSDDFGDGVGGGSHNIHVTTNTLQYLPLVFTATYHCKHSSYNHSLLAVICMRLGLVRHKLHHEAMQSLALIFLETVPSH